MKKLLSILTAVLIFVCAVSSCAEQDNTSAIEPTATVTLSTPTPTPTPAPKSESAQSSSAGSNSSSAAHNYIGNTNSKKFHKPTCSYLPNEGNREYFSTREEAINAGMSPCKHCNP